MDDVRAEKETALPQAVGAQVAHPDRQVIALAGDELIDLSKANLRQLF